MRTRKIVGLLAAFLLASLILFPFVYTFFASFFSAADFSTSPAPFFPSSWSMRNFQRIADNRYFSTYVANSLVTGLLSASIRMAIAVLASFAFSHYRFRGSRMLLSLIILTLFIPGDLLLSGNYRTVQRLGLLDSYLGIISTSLLPASQILMLRQYFLSIPRSIHDSALMDGCGDARFIISILTPLSKAVISTFFLQSFMSMFNSYLWPLLVTNSPSMRTVQIGITMLGYAESLNYGPIFAAITVLFIPFSIVFLLMHRHIMSALKSGYMFM